METVAQLQNATNAAAIASEVNCFRTASAGRRATSAPSRRKNVSLWILQGALAALFLFAGVAKLVMPAEDVTAQNPFAIEFLRFIGLAETLGAIGLVLPWALNIRSRLTSLAAAGLVVIMIGATISVAAMGDFGPALSPAIVGVLACLVASGRRNGKFTAATN